MKRIIIYLTLIILSVGCEDLLNKEPIAVVSESSAYITESDAMQALVSAYNVQTYYFNDNYSVFDFLADNALKGGEGPADGEDWFNWANFNLNSANYATGQVWTQCYLGVRRANLVIENVPTITMDEAKKARIIAEAKFLRAYAYMPAVTLFGDIPLITSVQFDVNSVVRDPKEKVWAQIVKDLTEAADVLPLNSAITSSELGRVSKGAAQTYLAKAYLYQGDFTNAELWLKKVIDSKEYSLNPNYYNNFLLIDEFGPEHIFEINHVYSNQFLAARNHGQLTQGSAGMYGYGFCCPTQDFVDEFEPGDPRLWQTVYKQGDVLPDGRIADVGNSETGYMSLKPYLLLSEYPPTGNPMHSEKNFLKARYGIVLLWYAEAAFENGKTTEALWALNEVRKRARQGTPNVLPEITTTDRVELQKAIWHEQRVEYGMENERYFELLRQGRLGTVMRAFSVKYNTFKGRFTDGVNELIPIPQTEIDLSQGRLKQNPGY